MILAKDQLLDLQKTATKAATEAGLYIQSQIDQTYAVQEKNGGDSLASQVVTAVDYKAQEIVLESLRPSIEIFDLGSLTEESSDDQSRLHKEYFWCIDPLDGTLPFTEKRPGYAVSIALIARTGNPVLGVIYVPHEQLCYTAIKGGGVLRNGQSFNRASLAPNDQLHWYMDRSFQTTSYYQEVKDNMTAYAKVKQLELRTHTTFGAVVNAIGVMNSAMGCYFKFPKKSEGGGSVWDYAATRLLFEELGLFVSNAKGERLHLNDSVTTFMNRQGVVFATNGELSRFLAEVRKEPGQK